MYCMQNCNTLIEIEEVQNVKRTEMELSNNLRYVVLKSYFY
jgi:hypothetical protein